MLSFLTVQSTPSKADWVHELAERCLPQLRLPQTVPEAKCIVDAQAEEPVGHNVAVVATAKRRHIILHTVLYMQDTP